jgi:hypothetical protein
MCGRAAVVLRKALFDADADGVEHRVQAPNQSSVLLMTMTPGMGVNMQTINQTFKRLGLSHLSRQKVVHGWPADWSCCNAGILMPRRMYARLFLQHNMSCTVFIQPTGSSHKGLEKVTSDTKAN